MGIDYKIFLGGTCANTTWRETLIKNLKVPYFNPVVETWTPEDKVMEDYQKETECNVHFYFISSEMQGVYQIAEVIDSCHTPGKITILHVDPSGFDNHQLKSLKATANLVNRIGGIVYIDSDLMRSAHVLNNCFA